MGIVLKTPEEIEAMRMAGQLAGEVLTDDPRARSCRITTGELDDICHAYITEEQQAIPAPLNYRGFPNLFALRSTRWFVMGFRAIRNSRMAIS